MPAYLRAIVPPTCPNDGRVAIREVRNAINERIGAYCAPCAESLVAYLNGDGPSPVAQHPSSPRWVGR